MRSLVLVSFLCIGFFTACTFNYDYNGTQFLCTGKECPTGFQCISGRCISGNTTTCGSDANCPAGHVCNQNICVVGTRKDGGPKDTKPGCSTNADCGVGGYCIEGTCTRGGQGEVCQETLQCQTGHVCQTLGQKKACLLQCANHGRCQLQQACRPSLTGGDSVCVPRCNPVTQEGCQATEVCVLTGDRGYCQEKRGKKPVGLSCRQDTDCEVHLYCRPVKGFPNFKRCAKVCNSNESTTCSSEQNCITLSSDSKPFGFCQPLPPPKAKSGELCGGDIGCEDGLKCIGSRCK